MSNILLEVCTDSIYSLKEAIKGGADRIELCSSLSEGGLTPSFGFIETAKKLSPIPIFVLIRPRSGNFLYSTLEFEIILKDIETAKKLGVDGIVCGFLDELNKIDEDRTMEAVKAAAPLPFTFHRAFDVCNDSNKTAMEKLIKTGVQRLLTSGRFNTAAEGIDHIQDLVQLAGSNLTVLAGSGINAKNAKKIIEAAGVEEIHASCKTKISIANNNAPQNIAMGSNDTVNSMIVTDAQKVKAIKEML